MSLDTWFLMLIFKTYCFLRINYNKNNVKTRTIFKKKRCTTKHKYYILLRTVFNYILNIHIMVKTSQALVSGNKNIPKYYIYHKVRNRSFVNNLGHRDFCVFSTRRTPAWRNGLHHLKLR